MQVGTTVRSLDMTVNSTWALDEDPTKDGEGAPLSPKVGC